MPFQSTSPAPPSKEPFPDTLPPLRQIDTPTWDQARKTYTNRKIKEGNMSSNNNNKMHQAFQAILWGHVEMARHTKESNQTHLMEMNETQRLMPKNYTEDTGTILKQVNKETKQVHTNCHTTHATTSILDSIDIMPVSSEEMEEVKMEEGKVSTISCPYITHVSTN